MCSFCVESLQHGISFSSCFGDPEGTNTSGGDADSQNRLIRKCIFTSQFEEYKKFQPLQKGLDKNCPE